VQGDYALAQNDFLQIMLNWHEDGAMGRGGGAGVAGIALGGGGGVGLNILRSVQQGGFLSLLFTCRERVPGCIPPEGGRVFSTDSSL
jgi:hypothetical protein